MRGAESETSIDEADQRTPLRQTSGCNLVEVLGRRATRTYGPPVLLTVSVPDEFVAAMHLPEQQVELELKKEMALGLYQRGVLSAGKASELAGLPRMEFEELLIERKIPRPYTEEDLEEDFRVVIDEERRLAMLKE